MDYPKRLQSRKMYKNWLPIIQKYYPRFDVYGGNWTSWLYLTPIEENVWADIRHIGLPFVPQFPVGPYFIDFADPIKKLGVEVDSKKWHKDKKKDEERQRFLEDEGWKIIRIQGWQTYKDYEDYFGELNEDTEDEIRELLYRDYLIDCSEGILRRIKSFYYPNSFWELYNGS